MSDRQPAPTAAEFFAGVGLVRMSLERAGYSVAFANDISDVKQRMYAENFGTDEFVLADIRDIAGRDVPHVNLATASFPCTDLSLAGGRAGLSGRESGLLGEFLRILREMGERRPNAVLIENVPGFASSNNGADILQTLEALNGLGYYCDVASLNARHFVPQSRQRLFILAVLEPPPYAVEPQSDAQPLRPIWARELLELDGPIQSFSLPFPTPPEAMSGTISDVLEPFAPDDPIWWDDAKTQLFIESLSDINVRRADALLCSTTPTHATAFRRTRGGKAVWEIRGDRISGCLRTTRGGSSRQAVVEGSDDNLRVRWMTAREYARLQGAPDFKWGDASDVQARFALGDAVCVPAVAWLIQHFMAPQTMEGGASPSEWAIPSEPVAR